MRILLLGGTTEASLLARALSFAGFDAVFSYAGRTESPVAQPLPTRIGGFGGVDGLRAYLRAEAITHVVDATHPFAVQMSQNAVAACAQAQTPLLAFERLPWRAIPGDNWTCVGDIAGAVAALPDAPARVFLAIGKQSLAAFAAKPQHHYLVRLVDPAPNLGLEVGLPRISVFVARGPFNVADDTALLVQHRISHIVAKNAGGKGAQAKLAAARGLGAPGLGLPVIMISRPEPPARQIARDVDQVLAWLDHSAALGSKMDRGV